MTQSNAEQYNDLQNQVLQFAEFSDLSLYERPVEHSGGSISSIQTVNADSMALNSLEQLLVGNGKGKEGGNSKKCPLSYLVWALWWRVKEYSVIRLHAHNLTSEIASTSTGEPSVEIDRSLGTEVQAICYLNEVLLPYDPLNKTLFEAKTMSTCQAYRLLMEYCSCLDNKSSNAFAKWCSSRKIKFLQADYFRKRPKHGDESTGRYRSIYAMKKEYLDDVVRRITNYLPAYLVFLENLKMEGYEIIGYARKFRGPEIRISELDFYRA